MMYLLWSCRNGDEAAGIARQLLEKKWIGCASILPKVRSLYTWGGQIEEAEEVKVLLKTDQKFFEQICSYIREKGSYEVPELVAIKADRVDEAYAQWLQIVLGETP